MTIDFCCWFGLHSNDRLLRLESSLSMRPLAFAPANAKLGQPADFGQKQSFRTFYVFRVLMEIQRSTGTFLHAVLAMVLAVGAANWSYAATTTPQQSSESFNKAIINESTSPSYVMITLIEAESQQRRLVCVTANLLLGAIDRENRSGDKIVDRSTLTEIALASPKHIFSFNRLAISNLPTSYSEEAMSAARTLLSPYSLEELKERFSLVSQSRFNLNDYDSGAIACALIEHGLSPKMADRSGQVYVSR